MPQLSNSRKQVLDYRTQQYRLFSLLSFTYALNFTYQKLNTMVDKYYKALETGKTTT